MLSTLIHAAAVVLLLLLSAQQAFVPPRPPIPQVVTRLELAPLTTYRPSQGGGGQRSALPASKGRLPKPATTRLFTPPMIQEHAPKLPLEAAVLVPPNVPLPDVRMDQYGDPFGKLGALSGGPGGPGGIGGGCCNGVGDNQGAGVDDSSGFSVTTVRHLSTRPVVLYNPEPEYSDDARKAHLQGQVLLACRIGADGRAHDIRVVHSLGLGLDERAIAALATWRFRPATSDGKAVAVAATVEVTFRLL